MLDVRFAGWLEDYSRIISAKIVYNPRVGSEREENVNFKGRTKDNIFVFIQWNRIWKVIFSRSSLNSDRHHIISKDTGRFQPTQKRLSFLNFPCLRVYGIGINVEKAAELLQCWNLAWLWRATTCFYATIMVWKMVSRFII